ncbi:hypothetical protein BGX28_005246 [Mortierella sp. GBA30]|nr:hypothetical protein BGX28_005246 [Mortierella sp. GBA30]
MWQNLELLYRIAFNYDATDLIYVLHKLRERSAFMYVAQNDKTHKPLMDDNESIRASLENVLIHTEKKITDTSLVPVEPLLFDLSRMAAEYHQAKSDLVSLALARRSSVVVMRDLKKHIPTGLNLREAKPVPNFLKNNSKTTPSGAGWAVSQDGGENSAGDIGQENAISNPTTAISDSATQKEPHTSSAAYLTPNIFQDDQQDETAMQEIINPRANYPIPKIFRLSMLQASMADFPVKIEDKFRQFNKDRMKNFEFAAAGELPSHDYKFPQRQPRLGKRKRGGESLDTSGTRPMKRKNSTTLKRTSEKTGESSRRRRTKDKGKGKAVELEGPLGNQEAASTRMMVEAKQERINHGEPWGVESRAQQDAANEVQGWTARFQEQYQHEVRVGESSDAHSRSNPAIEVNTSSDTDGENL